MRIGRTVPPAAAPLGWTDLWHGVAGGVRPRRTIRQLEEEIGAEFGVRHVFTISSGKAALTLTLLALKSLSPRRDVVIPAFTCFSVPAAVLQAGLRPVLCDIDSQTFDFDHAGLEQIVNGETLCVVGQHLFGIPAAIAWIREICDRHGAFLVEDAAQAMGIDVGGRRLGTFGDVGVFSLGRGKHVTCGAGGFLVTNSAAIGAAIARHYVRLPGTPVATQIAQFLAIVLMTIFIRPSLYWLPAALPFLGLGRTTFPRRIRLRRLSGVQAGLLRTWRERLVESNGARAVTTAYFIRRLAPIAPTPGPWPLLRLPVVAASAEHRRLVYVRSQQRGLGVGFGYPAPINEIPEIRSVFDGRRFPSARCLAERLLTLPTHPWVSERDRRAIVDLCRDLPAA